MFILPVFVKFNSDLFSRLRKRFALWLSLWLSKSSELNRLARSEKPIRVRLYPDWLICMTAASPPISLTELSQTIAPLVQCLQELAQRQRAQFHTPGHKQGKAASPVFRKLLEQTLQADLPELPELDNLFAPAGVIQQAQLLAAAAFGAEQTWFLCNGSTCGIEAAVLATCNPGDKIILPRNVHQSAISALILSGAVPVWVEPDYDSEWQIAACLTPKQIAAALVQHPDVKAVLVVSPTYHGICANLTAIAQLVHAYGIPLLVDEAHGAHFGFHPDLPESALAAGADLAVQSIHKTLSALTQAAMLHIQGSRIDRDRLSRSLQLVQSTSPNYLLLASLDAARQQMAVQGQALLQQTLELSAQAHSQLAQIPGLKVFNPGRAQQTDGWFSFDPTRLTVNVTSLGLTGFEADEILHQQLHVTAELPALCTLTFILTAGNPAQDIQQLVTAFQTLAQQQTAQSLSAPPTFPILPALPLPSAPLTPRAAFFAPSISLPVEQAIGRVSAELICPYPPGIAVLLPGELISREAISYLQQILAEGGVLTGCTDPSLDTLRVISP
jgi:arginine/lysine/ornithine decarboxylase